MTQPNVMQMNALSVVQEIMVFEPREFIAEGERVVTLGHYIWKVRATGKQYEGDFAHVFTVRDGRITRFTEFSDTAAIEAAYTP